MQVVCGKWRKMHQMLVNCEKMRWSANFKRSSLIINLIGCNYIPWWMIHSIFYKRYVFVFHIDINSNCRDTKRFEWFRLHSWNYIKLHRQWQNHMKTVSRCVTQSMRKCLTELQLISSVHFRISRNMQIIQLNRTSLLLHPLHLHIQNVCISMHACCMHIMHISIFRRLPVPFHVHTKW